MKIPSPHITLFTLFRYDLKRLINFYRTQKTRSLFATLIILLITAFFIVVEYRIALELFQHIMNQVHLEGLRYVLLAKILQMVYLIFTLLLVSRTSSCPYPAFFYPLNWIFNTVILSAKALSSPIVFFKLLYEAHGCL